MMNIPRTRSRSRSSRSSSHSGRKRLREFSESPEREKKREKRSSSGDRTPAALIWYNTNLPENEEEQKEILGYMRLIPDGDKEKWSEPYVVVSQEVDQLFADPLPDQILENDHYLLAVECVKKALSGLHKSPSGPGWSPSKGNNIKNVHDSAWAESFMESSEVVRNSDVLRDMEEDLKTHLLQTPIVKPIAQFAVALCEGLHNSDGRHGVENLINTLKYVIERSLPEMLKFIAGSYTAKSVGGGTPNDASLCVAYIEGVATKEEREIDDIKRKLLKKEMKIDHIDGKHKKVTDVNLLFAPPRGKAGQKEVVLTVEIKSGPADIKGPSHVAWLQGLAGLRYSKSSFCLTISPQKALMQSQELWDENILVTNKKYYNLQRYEKNKKPSFVLTNFMELIHDCMKVIYFHCKNHA